MVNCTFSQGNNALARRATAGMCAYFLKHEVLNPNLCFGTVMLQELINMFLFSSYSSIS